MATASARTWIVWVIASLAAITCIAAGYVSGTVDGDVPWPATAIEESTYVASTALTAMAGVLALTALAVWIVTARPKSGRATAVIIASVVVTALVFFASYAVGAL